MTTATPLGYELDPFLSAGEIAIKIPGLPVFFEENYHDAELAAQGWVAILLLSNTAPSANAPLDVEFAPVGWE